MQLFIIQKLAKRPKKGLSVPKISPKYCQLLPKESHPSISWQQLGVFLKQNSPYNGVDSSSMGNQKYQLEYHWIHGCEYYWGVYLRRNVGVWGFVQMPKVQLQHCINIRFQTDLLKNRLGMDFFQVSLGVTNPWFRCWSKYESRCCIHCCSWYFDWLDYSWGEVGRTLVFSNLCGVLYKSRNLEKQDTLEKIRMLQDGEDEVLEGSQHSNRNLQISICSSMLILR